MKKEEKVRLINRLKERISAFQRKKEEARQKLENGQYASEEEKGKLRDWAYESFPYGDVVSSMEEHLDSINLEKECCPDCGGKVVSFFFCSPQWTWDGLLGRAGDMKICVDCGKQFDFGFKGVISMS